MIIECSVPAGMHTYWRLWLRVIRRIRKCSIAIMTKDELGHISGSGQCTESGTWWWWNQQIEKATKAAKDDFMKFQLKLQQIGTSS